MQKIELPYDGTVEMYNWKEGARIIRDAGRRARKYSKGFGDNRRVYCATVGAFDIETSQVENMHWDKKKDPEMLHYFSFPYCWQFMIEGKFIFGQDPADFFEMLKRARSTMGVIVIYIHNITFEYNNLCDFFLSNLDEVEIFFKNVATPLYIRWRNFEFRCSALLTHKSLAMLGDDIGYPKLKGDLDYSIPRGFEEGKHLSPLEMNYCFRDVAILDKWIRNECMNYLGRLDPAALPFTQTGYPRKEIKETFSLTIVGRQILEECRINEYVYRMLKDGFYGGYTHENIRHLAEAIAKILHMDITSAYPWAMIFFWYPRALSRMTLNEQRWRDMVYDDTIAVIARVRFGGLKLKKGGIPYCPYNPNERKYKGEGVIEEAGKVFYAASYECTICDVDAQIILEAYVYDTVEIIDAYQGIKKPLPKPVIECVLEFFEKKTTLKGVEGREYEYMLAKQILNSLYGMTAQGLLNPEYELDGLDCREVTYEDDVLDEDGEILHREGDIIYNYEPSKVLPYQWCIYITAYVRRAIYGMIGKLESKADFYYSDTDSIFCKDTPYNRKVFEEYNNEIKKKLESMRDEFPNIIPVNPKGKPQYLGCMLEEDDDCKAFCTIGPKRYYIEHPDGTVDVTISGLRGTKTWKDENGIRHNGRNTQRLIDRYGSIQRAFEVISEGRESVVLPYEEGVDKLSNYNVRYPFEGMLCGKKVSRPCSFTLYPVPTSLTLNDTVRKMLAGVMQHDIRYDIVMNEIW